MRGQVERLRPRMGIGDVRSLRLSGEENGEVIRVRLTGCGKVCFLKRAILGRDDDLPRGPDGLLDPGCGP